MNTILNKLRISTGFATLSADECAELVAHIEAMREKLSTVSTLTQPWRYVTFERGDVMPADGSSWVELRELVAALRDKEAA